MFGFSIGQGAPERKLKRFSDEWNEDDVELMQYTGFNDKNGKKIYEGDVVKWNTTNWFMDENVVHLIGQITFEDAGFEVFSDGEIYHLCLCDEIEVIGNIHDNPDLINQEVA